MRKLGKQKKLVVGRRQGWGYEKGVLHEESPTPNKSCQGRHLEARVLRWKARNITGTFGERQVAEQKQNPVHKKDSHVSSGKEFPQLKILRTGAKKKK